MRRMSQMFALSLLALLVSNTALVFAGPSCKIKKHKACPVIFAQVFDDSNLNGVFDIYEVSRSGWQVAATSPNGTTSICTTPTPITAMPGPWSIEAEQPPAWRQTSLYIDGVQQPVSSTAQVMVSGASGEVHYVLFGYVQLGNILLCAFYDANGNAQHDLYEPGISNWQFVVTGILTNGESFGPVFLTTGADGCIDIQPLPGTYVVKEILPVGWIATTPTSYVITLPEGGADGREFGVMPFG